MKAILLLLIAGFSYGQIINFPDQNLKTKLILANTTNQTAGNTVIDTNGNSEIEQSEALQVTYLFLFGSNISNTSGLEYFTNLQYLYVHNNSISTINLSTFSQLIQFRCDVNNLSTLDLTGLNNLQGINIHFNNITNVDFSQAPNLVGIKCSNNQLTTLDFSENDSLTQLICSNNNLTSINIKNGTNHDFSNSNFNDCWKTGNPNLTTICVDQSELASVEGFLSGCGTPQTITVTSDCGLNTAAFVNNSIQLFPNPSQDYLNISGLSSLFSSEKIFATLFSIDGKKLKSFQFSNNDEQEISIHDVASGIYILKISDGNNEISERFIKN